MMNDEWEQRLWELEYGLLSDSEAAELRQRLESDSTLAAQHRQVVAHLALVARAAKVDGPSVSLRVPEGEETTGETGGESTNKGIGGESLRNGGAAQSTSEVVGTKGDPRATKWRRIANWSAALAAGWLVAVFVWSRGPSVAPEVASEFREPSLESSQPTVIEVAAPRQANWYATYPVSVQTRGRNGLPQSTELEAKVRLGSRDPFFSTTMRTDGEGRGYFNLPPEVLQGNEQAFLSFSAPRTPPVELSLAPARDEYVTRVSTDKPRYRPGDVVRFRSVTLSRFGLRVDREFATESFLTNARGEELTGSRATCQTDRGVGGGEFRLPPDSTAGRYSVFAKSVDDAFPPAHCDFEVVVSSERAYDIDVNWDQPMFAAATTIQGQLQVRSRTRQPVGALRLSVQAFVDGRQIPAAQSQVTTSGEGQVALRFTAPDQIASNQGELGVRINEQETLWEDIPLAPDQVLVDFYPEGGDLTPGVENRVYFHAHDADARPVKLRGKLVDSSNREWAEAQTVQDGRGVFAFQPLIGETYALRIEEPASIKNRPTLPPVVADSPLVLNAGAGVFEADGPLRLELRSRAVPAGFSFSVVARCRGVTVGQLSGTAADFRDGVCPLELAVIPETCGVVRVTVFDHSREVPEPLAERLVYRRPTKLLQVDLVEWPEQAGDGERVRGIVQTTNELGEPLPAVLGVTVLDDAVWRTAATPPAQLPTEFLLLGDLDNVAELEDANFYLSPEPTAGKGLDLLLGTQGWRRFDRIPVSRLALNQAANLDSFAYHFVEPAKELARVEEQQEKLGARRDRVAGSQQNKLYALPGESVSGEALSGIRLIQDVTDDAPQLFDNRLEVEQLADPSTNVSGVTGDGDVGNPSRMARGDREGYGTARRSRPRWQMAGGVVVLLLAFALRWRPRLSTLTGGGVVIAVGGLLVWLATAGPLAGPQVAISTSASVTSAEARSAGAVAADTVTVEPADLAPQPVPSAAPQGDTRESAVPQDDREMLRLNGARPLAPEMPIPAAPLAPSEAAVPKRVPPPPGPPMASDPAPVAKDAIPNMWPRMPGARSGQPEPIGNAFRRLAGEHVLAEKRLSEIDQRPGMAGMTVESRHELKRKVSASVAELPREVALQAVSDSPSMKGPNQSSDSADKATGDSLRRRELADQARQPIVRHFAFFQKPPAPGGMASSPETIYWNPLLVTDDRGRATIEFDMPSLRSPFRVLVDGHEQGRVGTGTRLIQPK